MSDETPGDVSTSEAHEAKVAEAIHSVLRTHFMGSALPGIGCWAVLVVYLAIIIGSVLGRCPLGGVIAIGLCSACVLYAVADWIEKRRSSNASTEASAQIGRICREWSIDRGEIFRIATEVMKIENKPFLIVIDPVATFFFSLRKSVDPDHVYSVQELATVLAPLSLGPTAEATAIEVGCKDGTIKARNGAAGWEILGSDFVESCAKALEAELGGAKKVAVG